MKWLKSDQRYFKSSGAPRWAGKTVWLTGEQQRPHVGFNKPARTVPISSRNITTRPQCQASRQRKSCQLPAACLPDRQAGDSFSRSQRD
jgi:hypothetical protein